MHRPLPHYLAPTSRILGETLVFCHFVAFSGEDFALDAQAEFIENTILQKRSKTTRHGQHDLRQIKLKRQLPGKAKWYTEEKVEEKIQ